MTGDAVASSAHVAFVICQLQYFLLNTMTCACMRQCQSLWVEAFVDLAKSWTRCLTCTMHVIQRHWPLPQPLRKPPTCFRVPNGDACRIHLSSSCLKTAYILSHSHIKWLKAMQFHHVDCILFTCCASEWSAVPLSCCHAINGTNKEK